MVKSKIIEEVKYIIENRCTIKETAKAFNCSIETIKKNISKLKNSEDESDKRLYEILKLQLVKNEIEGKKKGALTPHERKKRTLIEEDIKNIAIDILANNYTLDMASKIFNIPKSTLHEALTLGLDHNSEIKRDLFTLFEYHKSKSNPALLEKIIVKYNIIQDHIDENVDGYEPK